MSSQEIAILTITLFALTVLVAFILRWRKQPKNSPSSTGIDWYSLYQAAEMAVKDAEQMWLKEGLGKEYRLEKALETLTAAYPQLANFKSIALAAIRTVVYDMNKDKEQQQNPQPQVLLMQDPSLIK